MRKSEILENMKKVQLDYSGNQTLDELKKSWDLYKTKLIIKKRMKTVSYDSYWMAEPLAKKALACNLKDVLILRFFVLG